MSALGCAPRTSPWGTVEHAEELPGGAWFVSTASHGGIFLPPALDARMPAEARAAAQRWARGAVGWYEEDCCAAWPLAVFPELCTRHGLDREQAWGWCDAVEVSTDPTMRAASRAVRAWPVQVTR